MYNRGMAEEMRIAKYLAHQGYGSRREIEEWIDRKRVMVNGEVIRDKGRKVMPGKDVVKIDGKVIEERTEFVYLVMNKPPGVVSTVDDPEGRPTVIDVIQNAKVKNQNEATLKKKSPKVYPVGRLDLESRGLILLTNDGELTHRLTHPKYHVPRTYVVKVIGELSPRKLSKLRNGVVLKEGTTGKAEVEVLQGGAKVRSHMLQIVLYEGWHRQIRRMCGVLSLEVVDLVRVKMGVVELGELAEGEVRELRYDEVSNLKKAVGLG